MDEERKNRLMKWGSLILVFILIVSVSAVLPRYLTPPPQPVAKKGNVPKTVVTPAPQTGHIALVNEDQGADFNGQKLNLGNQIVPLFSDQDPYQWETVSRSAADSGLSQGNYQAVFYIPSNFTQNIFTFENQKPSAAVISYRANPKLTAEDTARVQTEFEKVRGTLNQQFSKIYWRFISDRINYINGNFAGVLQKEQQYLQAMSDFYKPSSLDMAQVFNAQLDQINQLLAETGQAAKMTADKQLTLTDTKTQISQQLDALNKLNDQLKKQIQTMDQTRIANEKLVSDATTTAQDASSKAQASLTGVTGPASPYSQIIQTLLDQTVSIDKPLKAADELTGLNGLINDANSELATLNTTAQTQLDSLSKVYTDPLDTLNNQINHSKIPINALIDPDPSNTNSQSLYNLEQALYQTAYNNASQNVNNDINSLAQSTKPGLVAVSQWNGETDILSTIDSVQSAISDLANNGNITGDSSIAAGNLGKINDAKNYIGPSLFIDPAAITATNNYDEAALKYYLVLLNNTKDSLTNLNNLVGNNPGNTLSASLNSVKNWIDQTTGELTSSVTSLETIQTDSKTIDQTQALQTTQDSIQKQYDSAVQTYSDALANQKTGLQKAENELANNIASTQQLTAAIVKPIQLTTPDMTVANTASGIAVTLQDNNFDQLNMIDQGIQNISSNESLILKDSKDVQSMVNGVQSSAGQLSNSWGQNVAATAELKSAIAQTLGNTGEPGNRNQNVYQQLSSPVSLAGLTAGNANNAAPGPAQQSAADSSNTPPVQQPFLTLLAVLIASILTGYFSYHYRSLSKITNGLITALLALVSSAAIIYYGTAQYNLAGAATIMWSVFTFGLITLMSAWIREVYLLSEIAGVLLTSALVVFFTLPLLRNSMDGFAFQNPAADVYLSIAYSQDYLPFLKGILAIALLTIPVFAIIGTRAIVRHVKEEKAHETEIL
ncbi:type VII secretion protein EsaA [Sporolactobacillus putidus]|uniref:Type VII secretion protein EsaA n=1 Tax=Sporolactobacillus putidus TaxID=492735 RepID=A0A917S2G8_9BACL|nr:type VII secretion protein EsaA [Sporolactobacillus putidus]GGL52004.1 hypothetical protein GCM10007968_15160 [Sporolactobacillus putidus]